MILIFCDLFDLRINIWFLDIWLICIIEVFVFLLESFLCDWRIVIVRGLIFVRDVKKFFIIRNGVVVIMKKGGSLFEIKRVFKLDVMYFFS